MRSVLKKDRSRNLKNSTDVKMVDGKLQGGHTMEPRYSPDVSIIFLFILLSEDGEPVLV